MTRFFSYCHFVANIFSYLDVVRVCKSIHMLEFETVREKTNNLGSDPVRQKQAVGTGASCLLLGPPGSNWCFSFAPELVSYSAPRDLHLNLLSPRF